jgi:hypothetical protein
MYFLYKNEYRFFLNLLKSPQKGTKVERRKMEGINQFGFYNTYIYGNVTMQFPV